MMMGMLDAVNEAEDEEEDSGDDLPPPPPPAGPPPTRAVLPPSKPQKVITPKLAKPALQRRSPAPRVKRAGKTAKRRATNAFLDDPTMDALRDIQAEYGSEKNELDDVELQMLRGVFAAHDENKDGIINKAELAEALVSLGFSPTEKLMTKYFLENASKGKKSWRIDLPTFLSASSKHLENAEDCAADVLYLFSEFDRAEKGTITAQDIRHLLHESLAPTRLSRQETQEFMEYAQIAKHGMNTRVDYMKLIDKLLF